jgi:hypothetical protein
MKKMSLMRVLVVQRSWMLVPFSMWVMMIRRQVLKNCDWLRKAYGARLEKERELDVVLARSSFGIRQEIENESKHFVDEGEQKRDERGVECGGGVSDGIRGCGDGVGSKLRLLQVLGVLSLEVSLLK